MSGMSAETGRAMSENEHIRQSVRDILTTRIGTRVKRRDYGSIVPDLIDQPGNPANRLRLMAATVVAVARWEPRILVRRAVVDVRMDGQVTVDMEAVRRNGPRIGENLSLSVALR